MLFSARLCLSRSWWNSWWKCRLIIVLLLVLQQRFCSRRQIIGFSQGQGSKACCGAARRLSSSRWWRTSSSGLQGFFRVQQRFGVLTDVDTPVPHSRGGSARGRLPRPLPGTGLYSGLWSCNMLTLLFLTVVERCSWRSSRPLPGTWLFSGYVAQITSTFPFLMVVPLPGKERSSCVMSPRIRVPQRLLFLHDRRCWIVEVLHGFPCGQSSTASAVRADFFSGSSSIVATSPGSWPS